MIQIGRDNHAVAGRIRQLGALGGNALGHGAPGAVVAHRASVSSWLELGQALHLNNIIQLKRQCAMLPSESTEARLEKL